METKELNLMIDDWVVQAVGTVCIVTIGQLRMYLSLCGFSELVKQLK